MLVSYQRCLLSIMKTHPSLQINNLLGSSLNLLHLRVPLQAVTHPSDKKWSERIWRHWKILMISPEFSTRKEPVVAKPMDYLPSCKTEAPPSENPLLGHWQKCIRRVLVLGTLGSPNWRRISIRVPRSSVALKRCRKHFDLLISDTPAWSGVFWAAGPERKLRRGPDLNRPIIRPLVCSLVERWRIHPKRKGQPRKIIGRSWSAKPSERRKSFSPHHFFNIKEDLIEKNLRRNCFLFLHRNSRKNKQNIRFDSSAAPLTVIQCFCP